MGFKVSVRPSGNQFEVQADETVLTAALRAAVALPYGCKNGACGTCKCKLISGELIYGTYAASALSTAERERNMALICCSQPTSDIVIEARELTGFGDIPVRKMPSRVAKIERPAPDVAILSLQLPAAERLQFLAGQYVEFILKDGARRSYSIANAPHADELLQLHIRQTPGGLFTDRLFGAAEPALKERDILRIEGPLGSFFLREDHTGPIVLLASGTGFAPVKAIAEHIFFERINHEAPARAARQVKLYWGVRSRQDLYMHELAESWAREQPNFSYVPVLSEPREEDRWSGRIGLVHQAVLQDHPDLSAHQVYACGAPIMVESARRDFAALAALSSDHFFADAFTNVADLTRSDN